MSNMHGEHLLLDKMAVFSSWHTNGKAHLQPSHWDTSQVQR